MDFDEIEMPTSRVLFRQSSNETRLSPVHLSEESNSEEDESPKVIDYVYKNEPGTPPSSRKSSQDPVFDRSKFAAELQMKLNTTSNKLHKNASQTKIKTPPPSRKTSGDLLSDKRQFLNDLQTKLQLNNPEKKEFLSNEGEACRVSVDKKVYMKELDIELRNPDNELNEISVGTMKAMALKKNKKPVEEDEERVGGPRDREMATSRPKSPRPNVPKVEKDESIWDKLGTLGRKKRIKEVQEVQAEGKYAIDSPGHPANPAIPPEDYNLDDNEERMLIDKKSYEDPRFKELLNVLIEWINDELALQRIIVQDLAEDLYDGQVLQKLLEKLTGDKLDVPEVTQSEEGQRQKLAVVLAHFNKVLGIQRLGHNKWSVEAIHSKNLVAIIHLLVALARHFRPPVRLTENVSVNVTVVQKQSNQLTHRIFKEKLTSSYDDVGMRCERDAFDTLMDHAPDKLQVVKKSLVTFVNKHLNKINFEVSEVESQFHDGVYLIMLMGLLEGFFVPHYSFYLTPHEFDQKVHNVNFAFELMEEVGLQKPKARPEDIVNQDLKSTLRVLYNLFLRYKLI